MQTSGIDFYLGKYKRSVEKVLEKFEEGNLIDRIWENDSTIWKEGKGYDELIKNRLGWLTLPVSMKSNCDEIISFADEIIKEKFSCALVLGMGGSTMCPEVLSETFGVKKDFLKLFVLDSTDPQSVFGIENSIDVEKTLFIVSSKSGGTIEVDSFFRYFFDKVEKKKGIDAGKNFIAITDSDTLLQKIAEENKFRRVFTNPSDIGGRFSALSYFGLVPAALLGIDIRKLLDNAEAMMNNCMTLQIRSNDGVMLGTAAAELALKGRDKITFLLPQEITSFGYWVEQLIAESTGKEGKGILPVEGESPGKISSYRKDRLFVCYNSGKENKQAKEKRKNLIREKFPVIRIIYNDLYDIGGQFYLWEFATAVMGVVLEINPFDEPNVKESKDNTSEVLKYFDENKKLPDEKPAAVKNKIQIFSDMKQSGKKALTEKELKNKKADDYFEIFFDNIKKGDYVALMAYIRKNKSHEKALQKIRELIRSKKKIATTLGYGPRFLHSTGQLHKGGPDKGLFMQIVDEDSKDIQIPGKPFSFNILKQAQAAGDYESLIKHNRRVLRLNIGSDIDKGLMNLYKIIKKNL